MSVCMCISKRVMMRSIGIFYSVKKMNMCVCVLKNISFNTSFHHHHHHHHHSHHFRRSGIHFWPKKGNKSCKKNLIVEITEEKEGDNCVCEVGADDEETVSNFLFIEQQ